MCQCMEPISTQQPGAGRASGATLDDPAVRRGESQLFDAVELRAGNFARKTDRSAGGKCLLRRATIAYIDGLGGSGGRAWLKCAGLVTALLPARLLFLPKIGLTALAGQLSPDLGHLAMDAGSAGTWSVAANATGPIFQGGKLIAQYREAKAAWDEMRLTYEKTVLNALAEVANALIARQKLEDVRIHQERAVRAYEESFTTSTKRYMAGKASYMDVLDAQQQLFPAESALAQTRLSQLLAIVQLYKALGGGWQHPLDRPGLPVPHEAEIKPKTAPAK